MKEWRALLVISAVCLLSHLTGHVTQAQLSVTSIPDTIFSGSSTSVVEESVLWLYCEVNSTSNSLSVSWSKDGGSLVQDVPHIRLRTATSSSSTTLLLVLDNVVSSDAGVYQCTAQDGLDNASGSNLTVTVLSSSTVGMLRIVTQDPLTMISGPVSYSSQTNAIYPNRTAVNTGANVTLSFTAGHVGDNINSYTTPAAVWLKDGAPAMTTPTDMTVGGNGQLNSTLSFTFQESDAGVYQCIFSGSGPQMFGTIPLRLDTGSISGPERVSPPVVFLTPPEKLVLEVKTRGGYDFIVWNRVGDSSFSQNPTTELVNFHEIFVRQLTTTSEYGTYRPNYSIEKGEARILVVPTVSPSTTAGASATDIVSEGGNVNIYCTSSGGPLPTVTWTINNQPTNFSQTDVDTNPTDTTTPGQVMSTLHIVNAQYPTNDGVYTCTGTNTISGSAMTESATITVQVQAVPMVEVNATDRSRVAVGENVTITCEVINEGNPSSNSFLWYLNNSLITPPNTTTLTSSSINLPAVMESDIGIYTCRVTNVAGTGNNSIPIAFGVPPKLSISFNETVALPGSSVRQVCSIIEGDLPVSFSWSSPGGGDLTSSQSSNTPASTIDIIPESSGFGVYTCIGSNSYGSSNITFRIITAMAPMVVNLNGQTEIPVGTTLSLSADITTYNLPLTNVIWSFNDEALTNGLDRVTFIIPSSSEQAPVMTSLQRASVIPVDSGEYKLTASNPAGSNELSITVTVTAPASITEPSEDTPIDIDLGSETTLTCVARGIPPPTIVWSSATGSISSMQSSSITIDNEQYEVVTSNLTIASIQRTDRMFTCSASNSGGMQNRSFILTVSFPPTNVTVMESSLQVLSPTDIQLSCSAESLPLPTFYWIRVTRDNSETLFNMSTMQGSKSFTVMNSDATSMFTISPTTAIDTATYVCMANNRLGISASNSTVNVYERPSIVFPRDQQEFIVHEQRNTTLTCIATGSPAPSISFFYKNQNVSQVDVLGDRDMLGSEESVFNSSNGLYRVTRTFTLTNSMDEDSGSIVCSASADIPSVGRIVANTSITLTVYVAANIINSPSPEVVTSPNMANFTCTASGLPTPSITWTNPDGGVLASDASNIEITDTVTNRQVMSTLRISLTSPSVSGNYYCNASNGVSIPEVVTSVPALLIVYVVPNITSHLPAGSSRYVVNVTDDIIFQCTATGVPPPDIQWCRGNVRLNSSTSSRYLVRDGGVSMPERSLALVTNYLVINDTEGSDAGDDYVCKALNMANNGMDMETFVLFVQVPPVVTAMNGQILANDGESVVLNVTITAAIPTVVTNNIRWYYTTSAPSGIPNFNSADFQEITNLANRTSRSTLTFSSDRLSLTIGNVVQSIGGVNETDQGRYFIRASNPAGDVNSFIDVIVRGPPQIVGGPQDRDVLGQAGHNITFSCEAIANPPHNISWSYTNASGFVSPSIININSANTSKYLIQPNISRSDYGQLTVLNINYEDRGTYTCTAVNSVGQVSDDGILTVQVAPTFIGDGITSPSNTLLSGSVAIFCHAMGFPRPSIAWQKDGQQVDRNITSFTFEPTIEAMENETFDFVSDSFDGNITEVILNNNIEVSTYNTMDNFSTVGVLLFDQLTREDNGSYTCVASNKLHQTTKFEISSKPVRLLVLERPDAPINVSIFDVGPLSLSVNFIVAYDGNRPVQNFIFYVQTGNQSFKFVELDNFPVSTLTLSNGIYSGELMNSRLILPFTYHSVRVVACNVIGCSSQSEASETARTDEHTSSPPLETSVRVTSTNITVTWSVPESSNGIITRYVVMYNGEKSYDPSFSQNGKLYFNSSTAAVEGNVWTVTLSSLTPGTAYSISVAAVNGAVLNNGVGEKATFTGNTLSIPPPPPPAPPMTAPSPISSNPRTYTIQIIDFSEMNGLISHYQVIVVLLPEGFSVNLLESPDQRYKSLSDFGTFSNSLCNGKPDSPVAYITAEFGRDLLPEDRKFVVGAEDNTGKNSPNDIQMYQNWRLCHGATYTFFIRAYPTDNSQSTSKRSVRQANQRQYDQFTSSDYYSLAVIPTASSNSAGIAVAVIIVLLLVVAVIVTIVLIFYLMKKKEKWIFKPKDVPSYKLEKLNGDASADYIPPTSQSALNANNQVPLGSLAEHVENMHLNENCGFFAEYKVIQENAPSKPCTTSALPENKPKNRYANIQCFEETRVYVKPVEGLDYDYVNANHIDGYNRPKEYIASQGPLPVTVTDMWRMVWEHDVPTVVMLTNLVEKMKIKCSQYWPDSGTATYGDYVVTLTNTITLSDFVIRCLSVKNKVTEETKQVRQYHYISWPDFGVPRHATPLLYFLRKIRSTHKYSDPRPILVHCSAGVGRTGTLITIDHELQKAAKEHCIDAFTFVSHLRQQRNFMVQTDAQYVFLHDALLEGALSGDTEVSAESLQQHMEKLEVVDADEESGYKREFQKLRQFKVKVSEFSDANDDSNKFKNRLANALPYNYNRVILRMRPGVGGSDYINASFIDGYTKKRAYIATQDPLENTSEDFWRMVWEKSSSVIVMLSRLEEDEKSVQYWPSSKEDVEKMGDFTLELIDEHSFEDYITRELKIVEASSGKSRTVKQFHFVAWPVHGAPASGAGMVDLMDQVTRKQQQTGDNPIVVHCNAGIGRTGAFCCLTTAIERVKAEGLVDVFYNIKHLRTQRAHMVQSVEQYKFCYKAILEYVQSLNNYSNFQ